MGSVVRVRRLVRGTLLALLLLSAGGLSAQTQTAVSVPGRGHGTVGVTFQHITITKRELIILREDFGKVTLRSAWFDFDYGLTDRLALDVTLPYKSNRYVGDSPHDPTLLANDHGETLLDDGRYHSNWGDFGVNLRWLWRTRPVAITPFVGYYTPSNDYPLYTETQAGRGQWRLDVGLNVAGRVGPPRRNIYWQAGYAYSYMEKTRPSDAPARRVNRSVINAEFGWRAAPRLTPYLILSYIKTHHGLEIPEFTGVFVSDEWYHHDQLLPWTQSTWALGVSYSLSDRWEIDMSYGRSLDVSFGHLYQPALSFSINRAISTRAARAR